MKQAIRFLPLIMLLASCSALKSNTTIYPKDEFILGNNKHGAFKVNLTNTSKNPVEVYEAPIDGGRHSFQVINPGQKAKVKVDPNTALYILNKSEDTASVKLKVTGDVGLSMGYKN